MRWATTRGNARALPPRRGGSAGERVADGALDDPHLLPRSLAQEAPQQAQAGESRIRRVAGALLAADGRLHLATDWQDYAEQMWDVLDATPGIANRAGIARHWRCRGRTGVRRHFETRGQKLGHGVWDLHVRPLLRPDRPRRRMDTTLTLTTDTELVPRLVFFTMAMFLFERIRADVVALVVLVVLGLTGLVPREDLFGGFAGNAVMSIIATMILARD